MKIRLTVLLAALLAIWGMKRIYADANADDLWWILAPTASLVRAVTGVSFALAPGEGYISRDRLFLIEKSCAGINFMIAAFGMVTWSLFHRIESPASAVRVLAAAAVSSFAAAIIVNAARIAVAVWLAAHAVAGSAFTAAQVHRLEGIVVYFGGLVLLYELVQRLDRNPATARCEP